MMPTTHDTLRQKVADFGQEHLFQYWDELDDARRAALLADIRRIDFALVQRLARQAQTGKAAKIDLENVLAPPVYPAKPTGALVELYERARAVGETALREGRVGAMVVAGGQGTRLGFDGPKGTYRISPVKNKTLFQLFAESLRATQQRYGQPVPWYIMTSSATDAATRAYFEAEDDLGLPPENVQFFEQGVMPAVDDAGRILLADKHRVALSPNGHGGSLAALRDEGVLADMQQRGIDVISYFQVDNPLALPADPLFIGLHLLDESRISSIAVPKADDLEKVGNFARIGDRIHVIEYSDLPESLAHAKNPDGSRLLDAGSIAIHLLDRRFVEELTGGNLEMPWHFARKKVPYLDTSTDRNVEPAEPNATKFEMFIFDAIPLAEKSIVVQRHRRDCFSPVKNASGTDSAETARRDMIRRALRWLADAGVAIPPERDGEPGAIVEISPLQALDAGQLAENLPAGLKIEPGNAQYLQ